MKWTIIGAGGIADRRAIPAILKDKNSELVAIMERVPALAKTLGEKYGVPYFTTIEEMLKTVDCDAVYIGTPVKCHLEQAMTALRYGKHAFIEKPIAMNADEGERLVKAFKEAGKQLTIGYMMKYHNLHQQAKEYIKQGGIGQVNDIRVQFSCWYPEIEGAWRQKKELGGGGVLIDIAVHGIELVEYLLDEEITDVRAFYSTRTFGYEVEDSGVFIFKTASGVLGHMDVNFNIPDNASESKLELYGSKGYIVCKGTLGQEENGTLSYLYAPQGDYSAEQSRNATPVPTLFSAGGEDLYLKQMLDFRACVKKNAPDYFYAERAVQVQRVIDAIYACEQP